MNNFTSFAGFSSFIVGSMARYEGEKAKALIAAAKLVEAESKRVIGTYDYGWPQLADATQADRSAKGFAPNDPLLRTGGMRDSIEHSSIIGGGFSETVVEVGSNDDKAVWQELGTASIPARSFLGEAAAHKEAEVIAILGGIVPKILPP